MADEVAKRIKQQPLDREDTHKYYPFPALAGLIKPPRPATQPVRRLPLQLASGPDRGQPTQGPTVDPSPFHGVTRLSVVVGERVSQTFNNGKGDVDASGKVLAGGKQGRYFDEVQDIFTIDPNLGQLRICWKVRNTDRFRKAQFELFSRDRERPIWSLTWDKTQIAANLSQGALTTGTKLKDGQAVPIRWTGSMDWAQTVTIADPAFPGGRLTADHSPYQLRLTINDGDPGADRLGYPLIAWTYLYVQGETGGDIPTPPEAGLASALAATLRQAALSGVPFCEGFEAVLKPPIPDQVPQPPETEKEPDLEAEEEPDLEIDEFDTEIEPVDLDIAVLAATLHQAAVSGVPFCEGFEDLLGLPALVT